MDVDTYHTPKDKKSSSLSSPTSDKSQVRRKLEMSSISSPMTTKKKKSNEDEPKKPKKDELLSIHSINWRLKTGIATALEILDPHVDSSKLDIKQKVKMVLSKYTPKQILGVFCHIAESIGVDLSKCDLGKDFRTRQAASDAMTDCLVNYWNTIDQHR